MSNKIKNPRFTTPRGTAVFPRLNEPDYKFDSAGMFTCKLAFDPEDDAVIKLKNELEELRDAEFKKFISENPKKKSFKVADVFSEELDEDGDPTGRILLNLKMKHKVTSKKNQKTYEFYPEIFDGNNVKINNPPHIGGGSILRGSFEAFGAGVDSSKTYHLSLRLLGVKILTLKEGGRDASAFGFGDDEDSDFVADADAVGKPKAKASAEAPESDDVDF